MSGIVGFVTRTAAGLAPPRSISRQITPVGVTFHYGGLAQRIRNHADCIRRWREWQQYHMTRLDWSDIAYTGGFCDHGYAFAGRGAGIRTAANGTNAGNQNWYAATWIGGEGEEPTALALAAAEWWIHELRWVGGAGAGVNDHSQHKATACAGNPLRTWIAGRSSTLPPVSPLPLPISEATNMVHAQRTDDGTNWLIDTQGRMRLSGADAVTAAEKQLGPAIPMPGKMINGLPWVGRE